MRAIALISTLALLGCVHMPSNLSPAEQRAWRNCAGVVSASRRMATANQRALAFVRTNGGIERPPGDGEPVTFRTLALLVRGNDDFPAQGTVLSPNNWDDDGMDVRAVVMPYSIGLLQTISS
jgi:hypothetical protein